MSTSDITIGSKRTVAVWATGFAATDATRRRARSTDSTTWVRVAHCTPDTSIAASTEPGVVHWHLP